MEAMRVFEPALIPEIFVFGRPLLVSNLFQLLKSSKLLFLRSPAITPFSVARKILSPAIAL